MGNQLKTTILLAVLTAFILWAGQALGGRQGMVVALLAAAGMNFVSYWFSDKIVLRMYGATEIKPERSPELFAMVEALARRAELPMPKLYLIPQDTPNAFATGRDPGHAVVAVTEGLLNIMEKEEVMGVLAHELSHVKNRDILIGSIAATMAGAIMLLANMARWAAFFGGSRGTDDEGRGSGVFGLILMSVLAPVAAMLIQMAISRSREYLADSRAAKITGYPKGLADALQKLGSYSARIPMQASPSTAHMFTVSPLSGRGLMNLFSTHPPIEERIKRLLGSKESGSSGSSGVDPNRQAKSGDDFWERLSRG